MKKLFGMVLLLGILSTTSLTGFAAISSTQLPVYNNGTNVDVTKNGANMNIKINGGANSVGTANWKSFNIGSNAKVNVNFTAANQTSLNYVDAAGGVSKIYGQLTNSGSGVSTGTTILINPNGVLFGNGANVNLNSFTATALDGSLDKYGRLNLKGNDNKSRTITVKDGAKIYGKQNVSLIGKNINAYQGSKISASKNGTVSVVTSDDVTHYIKDGHSDLGGSSKVMKISLNGEITAGNIDVTNFSDNKSSKLNVSNAVLKANGLSKNYDGSISLQACNDVNIDNSTISATKNIWIDADKNLHIDNTKISAKSDELYTMGGNIHIYASKFHMDNSKVSTTGDIDVYTDKNLHIDNAKISAGNSISLYSGQNISIDNNTIKANQDIFVSADKKVTADNNSITSGAVTTFQATNTKNISLDNNTIKAKGGLKITKRLEPQVIVDY